MTVAMGVKSENGRSFSLCRFVSNHKEKFRRIHKITAVLAFASPLSSQAVAAEVSPDVHAKCLKAADYSGCVEVQINGVASPAEPVEKCDVNGDCIAKKGEDRLGLPKIVDWKYQVLPDGQVNYYEIHGPEDLLEGSFRSKWHLIPHKGQKRYVGRRVIVHFYDQGAAPRPAQTISSGGGKTTCTSFGASVSCNTTPPITTYLPGSPGRAAGSVSISFIEVVDCKDRTRGDYIDGIKLNGNWRVLGDNIPWACGTIEALPILEMKL